MTNSNGFPLVFSGLHQGRLKLKNRLVMTATVTNLAAASRLTPQFINFYAKVASGGVAAIVTEGLSVHRTSVPNGRTPLLFQNEIREDLKLLSDEVHKEGAQLFGQLWHIGRNALWGAGEIAWAPSALRDPYTGTLPHQMSPAEIAEIKESFITSAKVLADAGFDGVELHGAHGYLLTQFLSPWSNTRTDDYGVDLEGRCRFAIELIEGIRKLCGEDFVVGLKLSGDEGIVGGITPDIASQIVQHLVATEPPDYLCLSQGNFSHSLERHIPDAHFPPAPFEYIYRQIRSAAGDVPLMFSGKVTGLVLAEELLEQGSSDLVGMSRALLADADLPNKGKRNAVQEIRPCIYCNYCWSMIHNGQPVTCVYNPLEGFSQWADRSQSHGVVRIVGAGPAGLEAALECSARGLQVDLYDQASELGGQLSQVSKIPSLSYLENITRFMTSQLSSQNVQIHLSSKIDAAQIITWIENGDRVILATGSNENPCPVPCDSDTKVSVKSVATILTDGVKQGERILIVDLLDNEPTYSLATFLSQQGANVTLISAGLEIGRRLPYTGVIGILRRLEATNVEIFTHLTAKEIGREQIVLQDTMTGNERSINQVDTVIFLGAKEANDSISTELRSKGYEVSVVGEAYLPRGLGMAIRHAKVAALDI